MVRHPERAVPSGWGPERGAGTVGPRAQLSLPAQTLAELRQEGAFQQGIEG